MTPGPTVLCSHLAAHTGSVQPSWRRGVVSLLQAPGAWLASYLGSDVEMCDRKGSTPPVPPSLESSSSAPMPMASAFLSVSLAQSERPALRRLTPGRAAALLVTEASQDSGLLLCS